MRKIYLENRNGWKSAQQSIISNNELYISVVICTRNRPNMLLQCVKSILNQSYPYYEIIIINDNSERNISEFINWFFGQFNNPQIKLYENREHRGICYSRNFGLKYSTGDIIAFIDDDAIADEDWLETLIMEYTNDEVVGVGGSIIECGRKILTKNNYKKNKLNRNGVICHNIRIGNIKELHNLNKKPVTFFMGGNMSFRRKSLVKIGGFDRYIKGNCYREESDLCLSIKKYGELIFQPQAKVFHFSSNKGGNQDIIKNDICKFIFWDIRNSEILYFKHLSFINSFKKSVFRLKEFIIKSSKNKILVKSRPNMQISSRLKLFYSLFLGFIQGLVMGIGYKLRFLK